MVGPATARELASRFQLESLGELEPGKAEPVAAHRVVGETKAESVRESPLVGRERELAAPRRRPRPARGRARRDRGDHGEPGIGKSRLVTEARVQAQGNVRYLAGNASSFTSDALLACPGPPARVARGRRRGAGRARPPRAQSRAGGRPRRTGRGHLSFLASLLGLTLSAHGRRAPERARPRLRAAADLRGGGDAPRDARPGAAALRGLRRPPLGGRLDARLMEELFDLADREAAVLVLPLPQRTRPWCLAAG